jgi:hypothetical protein
MPPSRSAALPIAYIVVRILIVLNWLYATVLVAILGWSIAHEQWMFRALGVPVSEQTGPLVAGMQAIAALGILTVPFNLAMLKRVIAMIDTVRAGDPFVAANAYRLQAIAWILLALQFIGLVVWAIAKTVSTPAHPLHLNAGFSPAGWLAVLLTFVLARVFAEGTLMRQDLDGTV